MTNQPFKRCCLPVAHSGSHLFVATARISGPGECQVAPPEPTFYEQQKARRKARTALAIRREAAILAEERYNGLRLCDLNAQQLADVMADATEGVLS